MKPPICCVCDQPVEPDAGDLVAFADYEPLPEDVVGHPRGLEWFCGEHLAGARALAKLDSTEAIARLRGD